MGRRTHGHGGGGHGGGHGGGGFGWGGGGWYPEPYPYPVPMPLIVQPVAAQLPDKHVHGYPGARGGGGGDGHGGGGSGSSGRPAGSAYGGGAAPFPEYYDRIDSESPVVQHVVAVPAVHGGYWLVDPGD